MIRLKRRNPFSFFSGIVFNSDGFFRWLFIPWSPFLKTYQLLNLYQKFDLNTIIFWYQFNNPELKGVFGGNLRQKLPVL